MVLTILNRMFAIKPSSLSPFSLMEKGSQKTLEALHNDAQAEDFGVRINIGVRFKFVTSISASAA